MSVQPIGYSPAAYAPDGNRQIDCSSRGGYEAPQGFGGPPLSPAATVEFSQEAMRMSRPAGGPESYGQPGGGFGGPGSPGDGIYGSPQGRAPVGSRGDMRGQGGPPDMQRGSVGSRTPQEVQPPWAGAYTD
jgi:hypothetical protein